MIRHPTPRLVRDPDQRSPTAITPLAVVIRTPADVDAGAPAPGVESVDVNPRSVLAEIVIGVRERAIEITARSASVSFCATQIPALEVVGTVLGVAHEIVETVAVDLRLFAGAHALRAIRSAHFDGAVEHDHAIRSAIAVDGVDRFVRREIAGAFRIDAQKLAAILGALHRNVAVAEIDDGL